MTKYHDFFNKWDAFAFRDWLSATGKTAKVMFSADSKNQWVVVEINA